MGINMADDSAKNILNPLYEDVLIDFAIVYVILICKCYTTLVLSNCLL